MTCETNVCNDRAWERVTKVVLGSRGCVGFPMSAAAMWLDLNESILALCLSKSNKIWYDIDILDFIYFPLDVPLSNAAPPPQGAPGKFPRSLFLPCGYGTEKQPR